MFARDFAVTCFKQQIGLLVTLSLVLAPVTQAQAGGVNILSGKGGGGAAPAAAASQAAAQQGAAAAQQAAQQSVNALTKASQAIQAMRAAQSAARSLAIQAPTNVTNGLSPGGLVVDPRVGTDPSLWVNAAKPTQQVTNGQVTVTIEQQAQKALLTWQQFNVGRETTVHFDQSKGNAASGNNWVALNRINATGAPSQILGQIKAEGTVLLINPNGIIFNGSSQVNVGSLIASSASIDPAAFMSTGIYSTQSGSSYLPSFTNAGGKISVEAGAEITTAVPKSVTSGGGYVMLMGTEVTNSGTISTPKGQALLSAGDSFILRSGYSTTSNQFSTTRGTEISPVIAVGSAAGKVTNAGLIFAQQGDITLAGHDVTQGGILVATTSVNQRGTIHLLNAMSDVSGSVTLTGDAITAILPELDSKDTALDSQRDALIAASTAQNLLRAQATLGQFNNLSTLADRLDQSRVEIVTGGNAVFEGGSYTAAQGGQIAVQAGKRIFTETGATLDVSGVRNVALAMGSNNISINVQGNELRDSPQNRDSGYLANENVWIDVRNLTLVPAGTGGYASDRYYTPGGLLEVGGYLGNTAHSIGEWTAVGGTVTLSAPEIVGQKGSIFNLSGGSVAYQGGYIRTTNFLGADGRLYNIGDNAPADMKYYGVGEGFIRNHEHWGQIEVWMNPFGLNRDSYRWEDGYTVGRDAGRLILSTPTSVFEGDILASVIQGERQINSRPTGITDGYKATQNTAALAGTLALGQYTAIGRTGASAADVQVGNIASIAAGLSASDALPGSRAGTAWFNADALNAAGLGGLSIASSSAINVTADLTLGNGGQAELIAPVISVNAPITARAGSVTLSNVLPRILSDGSSLPTALPTSSGRPSITINAVAIDTRGLWTNLLTDPGAELARLAYVNGGNVVIRSTGDVVFKAGSVINASSGGAILATGKTKGGQGGNIALSASYNETLGIATGNQGDLTFDGKVVSNGITKGGALTLETGGAIVIGGIGYGQGDRLAAGTVAPYDLTLSQSFTMPAGTVLPLAATLKLAQSYPGMPISNALIYQNFLFGFQAFDETGWRNLAQTQAAWTDIPFGMYYSTVRSTLGSKTYVPPGGTLPAGVYVVQFMTSTIKKDEQTVVPTSVFPNGVALFNSTIVVNFSAGAPAPVDVTYAVGTAIPKGTVLNQDTTVNPVLSSSLSTDLFKSGFSSYRVNGASGLTVASAASVTATMPVYQFSGASFAAPTGVDPATALELWTPPAYIENPTTATLTQRAGADITLSSSASGSSTLNSGFVTIAPGASVTVDPGRSITLSSGGAIDVEGNLTAHGGTISLAQTYLDDLESSSPLKTAVRTVASSYGAQGRTLWVGDTGVLDVSAVAYTATDARGRTYGVVPDGGQIKFGRAVPEYASLGIASAADAFIVIRPGAVLDASGTRAVIDLETGAKPGTQPISVASDGGSITLNSFAGILAEGSLRAHAGGASASGGVLSVILETPNYSTDITGNYLPTLPEAYQVGRVLTIGQSAVPGALPAGSDSTTAVLVPGQGGVSADAIAAGGFYSLNLGAGDAVVFDGNVSLAAGRSITLKAGALYDTDATAAVSLRAPYIFLDGIGRRFLPDGTAMPSAVPSSVTSVTGDRFAVDADLIDVRNAMTSNFADTRLTSQTDLRFLSGTAPGASAPKLTAFTAPTGNLELTAEQLYPVSGAQATVAAGYYKSGTNMVMAPGATLTIASVDGVTPALPYSVFGNLSLQAPIVKQGGVVRAPLGSITVGLNPSTGADPDTSVYLLPGSLTSVSAKGLTMPFGGTIDGVIYTVDGAAAIAANLLTSQYSIGGAIYTQGVTLNGTNVVADKGAKVDLSGGGTLAGAAFVSGRGGSVDVLTTPFANANPFYGYSSGGNEVYAVVPGVSTAPVAGSYYAAWTGSKPSVGRQITIPSGVAGLPAGTYTLLPANYAMLPGAFRVEVGTTGVLAMPTAVQPSNGSYLTTGYQGIANTAIRDSLSTQLVITPGSAVRSYSKYNEESYSDFRLAQAATFGSLRTLVPMDGKSLTINLGALQAGTSEQHALIFNGSANFETDRSQRNGYDGSLTVTSVGRQNAADNTLQITSDGSTTLRTSGVATVKASTIEAIGAPNIYLGGNLNFIDGTPSLGIYNDNGGQALVLESGATLRAAQVVLNGTTIALQTGAVIDTLGRGVHGPDSSTGYMFASRGRSDLFSTNSALLILSNGHWVLDASNSSTSGDVTIGDGVSLLTDSTLGFITKTGARFVGTPKIAAGELSLALSSINIGSADAIAAALQAGVLPTGLNLDQSLLDMLLTGSAAPGAKGIKSLSLAAQNSINFYGTSTLDFTAAGTGGRQLVLAAPAIYGAGGSNDIAAIKVDTLVWNGTGIQTDQSNGTGDVTWSSVAPGPVIAGGAGTGAGSFVVDAKTVVLGYPAGSTPEKTATLDRLMLGFSSVTFNASEKITANNKGTLAVYQSGPSPTSTYTAASYAGAGGTLNLLTPLLTGDPAAILKIYSGGDVNIGLPAGASVSSTKPSALGAEIGITSGGAVGIDTLVWLPSGRFSVTAAGDIALGANSQLNLSGQIVPMFDVTKYTWGGDVVLESTHGNINQAAGSAIDISASGDDAGSLTLTATDVASGKVNLTGTIKAVGASSHKGGSFDLRAQRIGDPANLSADFAALNATLDAVGFTESRGFDLKQGSLTIAAGQTVKAHEVSISIDGGSLTVNGTVDASGTNVSSIILAARDDLTVNGTLDAHGKGLDADSKGIAIAANNAAAIDLTTKSGTLRLNPNAVFDLSTPGAASYGKLTLNAPRLGSTGGSATGAGAPANATGNDIAIDAAGSIIINGAKTITLNGVAAYTNAPPQTGSTDTQMVTQAWMDLIDQDSQAFMNGALGNASLRSRLAGLKAYGDAFHLRPGVEIDSATPGGNLVVSGDVDLSGYRYGPKADRNIHSADYGVGEPMAMVVRAGGNLTVNGSIADGFKGKDGMPAVYGGVISDLTNSPNFGSFGDEYYYSGSALVLYLISDWIIPNTEYYQNSSTFFDDQWNAYSGGDTIPAGTVLQSWALNFQKGSSLPVLATTLVSAATSPEKGTSPSGIEIVAGGLSASIRLASGADLAAAETRTLAARSVLAGSGNLTLSDAHTISGIAADSVLRVGTGDLDLRAGGNFAQDSFYNVSTNGGGENAPADLTVHVQGDLTGKIGSMPDATGRKTSSYVRNWLTGTQGTNIYQGFSGFGALGGGRVTIQVGGDVGTLTVPVFETDPAIYTESTGLVVAATSGDVSLNIGGRLNPNGGSLYFQYGPDINGVFTALRGDLTIKSGTIGVLPLYYGQNEINDPRGLNYASASMLGSSGGASYGPLGSITVVAGDGATSLSTRGDLALGQVGAKTTAAYWTPATSVSLFSAGGNLTPITAYSYELSRDPGSAPNGYVAADLNGQSVGVLLPPRVSAVAASGSIYYSASTVDSRNSRPAAASFQLTASPSGSLELLAMDSIYGAAGTQYGRKFAPARWEMLSDDTLTLHNGDENPIRVYAVNGDLINVVLGETYAYGDLRNNVAYVAAKAARLIAGGDIVNFGRAGTYYSDDINAAIVPSLILNTNADDVSMIKAGGNIYYANVDIAGPGTLEVTAGGTIYQGDKGAITSVGPLATGDARFGASISVSAGLGRAGAEYAALYKYLDPVNLANANMPLADQPGKVARTYESELKDWLKTRFRYTATSTADAIARFETLPTEQQRIFLNQVYFSELTAGGREYNDPVSRRYLSYLRGRDVIATLFPESRAYSGDLVMFGNSGIRTLYGGDITVLTPGGQQVIGVEGQVPGGSAGLITQGSGNISLHSKGSILLGLSRIMTTYGGNIVAWSAEGDINAGRGAKTTVVYTPPKRIYDAYGHVTLSPVAPSSGAGIATLNPIPEIEPGNIDLIAPLGTIDAGEAGIRVSGNVNLAALQIINAANIQVQGATSGIPVVQPPSVSGLTQATNTASASTKETAPAGNQAPTEQPSIIIVEVVGYGGGDGPENPKADKKQKAKDKQSFNDGRGGPEYNKRSAVLVAGYGALTDAEASVLTEDERRRMKKR